ncbi:hypothetical protein C8J57DRAFT_1713270 [Mycena rebaudengoi]|nr:hypothetical protein C8J57DRAFT_1713270 [Mycena rebaudengoi]
MLTAFTMALLIVLSLAGSSGATHSSSLPQIMMPPTVTRPNFGIHSGAIGAPAPISTCASKCIISAVATSDCLIQSNIPCMCTDTNFQAKFTSCLETCHPAEMRAALSLFAAQCVNVPTAVVAEATGTAPLLPTESPGTILPSAPVNTPNHQPPLFSSHRNPFVSKILTPSSSTPSFRPSFTIANSASVATVAAPTESEVFLPQTSNADIPSPTSTTSKVNVAHTNGISVSLLAFGVTALAALALRL